MRRNKRNTAHAAPFTTRRLAHPRRAHHKNRHSKPTFSSLLGVVTSESCRTSRTFPISGAVPLGGWAALMETRNFDHSHPGRQSNSAACNLRELINEILFHDLDDTRAKIANFVADYNVADLITELQL